MDLDMKRDEKYCATQAPAPPPTTTVVPRLVLKPFADRQTVFTACGETHESNLVRLRKKRNAAGTCRTANPEPVCMSS